MCSFILEMINDISYQPLNTTGESKNFVWPAKDARTISGRKGAEKQNENP